MAIDFNQFLDRKYDILEGRLNGAGAAPARPFIPGAETANSIALREAAQSKPATQISGGGGLAAYTFSDPTFSKVSIGDGLSSTGRQSLPVNAGRGMMSSTSTSTSTSGLSEENDDSIRLPFKMGTARVPGKGDGTKDTVKAKLAPGEAVLNKAAADKMGRGLIAALNKMGAQKMGLV